VTAERSGPPLSASAGRAVETRLRESGLATAAGVCAMPRAPTSTPGVLVRDAGPPDLRTIVELRLALLREHDEHPIYGRMRPDAEARAYDAFAAQLDGISETVLLAERGGETVGILRCVESAGSPLLHPARYCYVSSVYVRPDARRSGVLHALFARAVQWCEERDLDEMRLHNIPATDAEAAWDALGFEVVEHVRVRRVRDH
jgi:GNAT superfamily N-acetyltransferase